MMRAPGPRGVSFAIILIALLAVACSDPGVAPNTNNVTPPNDTENIGVPFADGEQLNGHLFGGANDTLVILTHMRRGDQSAWFEFAEELAANGFAALTFDFRGYGESDGKQDFAMLDDDLRAVLRYMRARGKESIFLVGASMGGTAALVVAAEEPVDGVVSVSSPDNFEGQDALAAVSAINAPKLFLASTDDAAAVLSLEALRGAAGEPKAWHVFDGNDHGTDLLAGDNAAEFKELVITFLREQAGT